jgi:polyisoprenoid-binding protein YceI
MTNYLAVLGAGFIAAGAWAAEPGTSPDPATIPQYRSGAGSTLTFTFDQAGAASQGKFGQFTVEMAYDPKNLAGSSMKVIVQVASLDTQDKDRDATLAGEELMDARQFPTAIYVASSFAPGAGGKVEAVGKLTLRGVTRELRIPLTIKPAAAGLELSGATSINRLDYGVGQGEWKSTEWVGNTVKLEYKVALNKAAVGG